MEMVPASENDPEGWGAADQRELRIYRLKPASLRQARGLPPEPGLGMRSCTGHVQRFGRPLVTPCDPVGAMGPGGV